MLLGTIEKCVTRIIIEFLKQCYFHIRKVFAAFAKRLVL